MLLLFYFLFFIFRGVVAFDWRFVFIFWSLFRCFDRFQTIIVF